MESIETLFTSTDLAKMYTKNKIYYNPCSYTLKDRLFIGGNKTLDEKRLTSRSSYLLEYQLCAKIVKYWGTDDPTESLKYEQDIYEDIDARTSHNYNELTDITLHIGSAGFPLMHYRDNLYINLNALYAGLTLKETCSETIAITFAKSIKSTKVLDAIIQLAVALNTDNSLVKYLGYLQYTRYTSLSLEDIIADKPLVNDLLDESKLTTINQRAWQFPHSLTHKSSKIFTDDLTIIGYEDAEINAKYLTTAGWFKMYLFGFEVLHAITTIKDLELRTILLDLLTQKFKDSKGLFKNEFYDVDASGKCIYTEQALKIMNENDSKKRFSYIQQFVENRKKYLSFSEAASTVYLSTSNTTTSSLEVPYFFGKFCEYCDDLSTLNIYLSKCLRLIKYCKSKDIDLAAPDFKEGLDDSDSKLCSSMITTDSDTESPTDKKARADDIGSLPSKGSLEHGTSSLHSNKSVRTPSLEALDKSMAEFEDGRYKFTVKDDINSSDTYKDKYIAIASKSDLLNKTLIKRIRDIKTYNEGGKNPGQKSGKLDMKNIYKYKTSPDIFYRNNYKIKESDLAFGIILDVSGSMSGKGIKYGRATMIVLHETLKALNINHCIITHTTYHGDYTCDLKRYQAFKEDATFKAVKNYALVNIKAESGNCDSAALYYMEKEFSRVKNNDKICLMFSDGQPTECTDTDLKDQVKHMERHGIKVIGIGVGFPEIKEYYKEYANGNSLKEMFDIISNILKQYVLDKKD